MDIFSAEKSRLGESLFSAVFNHRPYVLDAPTSDEYECLVLPPRGSSVDEQGYAAHVVGGLGYWMGANETFSPTDDTFWHDAMRTPFEWPIQSAEKILAELDSTSVADLVANPANASHAARCEAEMREALPGARKALETVNDLLSVGAQLTGDAAKYGSPERTKLEERVREEFPVCCLRAELLARPTELLRHVLLNEEAIDEDHGECDEDTDA